MSADKAKRPIVVVRRAHAHEDEHGGSWKIAYADFVTAMMAFFLVMWLLASVTEKQKRGLARYFNATSIMDMRTGDGIMDGGKSMLDGMTAQMVPISTSDQDGSTDADANRDAASGTAQGNAAGSFTGTARPALRSSDASDARGDRVEEQRMNAMKAEIERLAQEGELKSESRNVLVEVTPDGLRVQIFDRDGAPMFAPGSTEPNRRLTMILDALLPVLGSVRNSMTISGHTDNQPTGSTEYSNWELSTGRANATRRYLEAHGLAAGRVTKVEGRASTDPLLPEIPGDPRNRRIALTLLRENAAANQRSPGPPGAGHT